MGSRAREEKKKIVNRWSLSELLDLDFVVLVDWAGVMQRAECGMDEVAAWAWSLYRERREAVVVGWAGSSGTFGLACRPVFPTLALLGRLGARTKKAQGASLSAQFPVARGVRACCFPPAFPVWPFALDFAG